MGTPENIYTYTCFLGPHPQPMEVPRLGVELELQLLAYATAIQDPRHVFNQYHSSWQRQTPNPLSEHRDWTKISWILVGFVSAAPQRDLRIFFNGVIDYSVFFLLMGMTHQRRKNWWFWRGENHWSNVFKKVRRNEISLASNRNNSSRVTGRKTEWGLWTQVCG